MTERHDPDAYEPLPRQGIGRTARTVFIIALLVLVGTPWLLWRLREPRPLDVLIIDKTVPRPDRREHRGLVWILNHYRYEKSTGGAYDHTMDYAGFHPVSGEDYRVRPVFAAPGEYDLIYVADTYGVFSADLSAEDTRGARSSLLFGGLFLGDVRVIEQHAAAGGAVIAEFNTLASPTGHRARTPMEALLGVKWSGWIGRYFIDLDRDGEIPIWAVRGYERQTGGDWDFSGAGFVFVHDDDRIVVAPVGEEVKGAGARIEFGERVADSLGVADRVPYRYWFDIVEPAPGARVLARYTFRFTPEAGARLAALGIPDTFPAIVLGPDTTYRSWYFAGDFVDSDDVPRLWQFRGVDRIKRHAPVLTWDDPSVFFWRVYVPLMRNILAEIEADRQNRR